MLKRVLKRAFNSGRPENGAREREYSKTLFCGTQNRVLAGSRSLAPFSEKGVKKGAKGTLFDDPATVGHTAKRHLLVPFRWPAWGPASFPLCFL